MRYVEKVLATRIRILCTVLCDKTDFSESRGSFVSMEDTYRQALYDLLAVPYVSTAVRDACLDSKLVRKTGNISERLNILRELTSLCTFIDAELGASVPVYCNDTLYDLTEAIDQASFLGHSEPVRCLQIYNGILYSGSIDASIRVWDVDEVTQIGVMKGHSQTVNCLAFHEDRVYSGSKDSTIIVWDVKTVSLISTLRGHTSSVYCLAVDPIPERLYSGSSDRTIRQWDMKTLTEMRILKGHTYTINCLAVVSHNNGKSSLISGSSDRTLRVWSTTSGSEEQRLECGTGTYSAHCVAQYKDKIFTSSDNIIRVWSANTFELIDVLEGHTETVWCLAIAGNKLFSGSFDDTVQMWNMDDLARVRVLSGHTDSLCGIAVYSGRLYSGSGEKDIRETLLA